MYPYQQPDASGHFGIYGGSFVSETLTHAINELKAAYARYQHDPAFLAEFHYELKHFVGRPSPIYHAARMSREQGGAQIYLKREDLNHTGAHKINNTIGQAMLARRMGKPRIIAETGAGQHGVATATICARYGLECVVYMGSEDIKRQSPNVYRMKLLGATVVPVESGSKTLKERKINLKNAMGMRAHYSRNAKAMLRIRVRIRVIRIFHRMLTHRLQKVTLILKPKKRRQY